jgi:PAS domain-containing protein
VNEEEKAQREARAREVRHEVVTALTLSTHRTFAVLFAVQWPAALLLAWNSSLPGESRLWFTLVLGAMLAVPAMLFARAAPAAWWVRHFMALSQVGWSLLFMWLLEGRSEAQFHLFVSLAFIAFYRDWTVMLTASVAAIAYPVARIALLPESFVVGPSALWRIFDQGIWVICEAGLLMLGVQQSLLTIYNFARREADLRSDNEFIKREADENKTALSRATAQQKLIAEVTRAIPFELDLTQGRFTFVGAQAESLLGYPVTRWQENGFLDVLLPREREAGVRRQFEDASPGTFEAISSVVTGDDRVVELRWTVSCDLVKGMRYLRGLMVDVTETHRLVREMAQGQKLESVGRVAAGVAHEINTSVQFISDSVRFVRHALKDLPSRTCPPRWPTTARWPPACSRART